MNEKEYIIKVRKDDVKSRMFRYHIEFYDPEDMRFVVKHTWASYRFTINKEIKKALRELYAENNRRLIAEFRAVAKKKSRVHWR